MESLIASTVDQLTDGPIQTSHSHLQTTEQRLFNSSASACAKASSYSTQRSPLALDLSFYLVFYKLTVPLLFGLIVVIGVAGNSLVIFLIVSCHVMRRNSINLLLLNLAVSDLLLLLVCVPFVAYHYSADNWIIGDVTCKLSQFLFYATTYVTIYTLVVISVFRLRTVTLPGYASYQRLKPERGVRLLIVGLWVTMLAANAPIVALYRVKSFPYSQEIDVPATAEPYFYCGLESHEHGQRIFVSFFVLAYVGPLLAIATMYLILLRHLQENGSGMAASGNGLQQRRTSHVTQVLCAVVATFAICWLPLHVHLLIVYFVGQPEGRAYEVFRALSHSLAYANSCVNPIIYSYISSDFRHHFRSLYSSFMTKRAVDCRPQTIKFQKSETAVDQNSIALIGLPDDFRKNTEHQSRCNKMST